MAGTIQVFTVGHSNHTIDRFIELLQQHQIALIVDVRSQPYSQWATQFNRELLRHDLETAGIHYTYFGNHLGGRPDDRNLYDPGQERPNYKRMAESRAYQDGIAQLLSLAEDRRLAVMCSEGDFRVCHRHLLITQTLVARGVRVHHIEPDGTLTEGMLEPEQLSFF